MSVDDVANWLIDLLVCPLPNSQGTVDRPHDWSDPHRKWSWAHWRRITIRRCIRCGYQARILR